MRKLSVLLVFYAATMFGGWLHAYTIGTYQHLLNSSNSQTEWNQMANAMAGIGINTIVGVPYQKSTGPGFPGSVSSIVGDDGSTFDRILGAACLNDVTYEAEYINPGMPDNDFPDWPPSWPKEMKYYRMKHDANVTTTFSNVRPLSSHYSLHCTTAGGAGFIMQNPDTPWSNNYSTDANLKNNTGGYLFVNNDILSDFTISYKISVPSIGSYPAGSDVCKLGIRALYNAGTTY